MLTPEKKLGEKLRSRRKFLNRSMKEMGERIGVSENYISEIERGIGKQPSNDVLRKVSEEYGIDSLEVFEAFDRIPVDLVDELRNNKQLLDTLYEIKSNRKLTNKQKAELYKRIVQVYEDFLKDIKG